MSDKLPRPFEYSQPTVITPVPFISWGEHRAVVKRYSDRVHYLERVLRLVLAEATLPPLTMLKVIAEMSEPVPPINQVRKGHGYVYVIQSLNDLTCKIGVSRSFKNRAKQFAAKLPFKWETVMLLQTFDYKAVERTLHETYQTRRLEGEWFELTSYKIARIWEYNKSPIAARYFGRYQADENTVFCNPLYVPQNEAIMTAVA